MKLCTKAHGGIFQVSRPNYDIFTPTWNKWPLIATHTTNSQRYKSILGRVCLASLDKEACVKEVFSQVLHADLIPSACSLAPSRDCTRPHAQGTLCVGESDGCQESGSPSQRKSPFQLQMAHALFRDSFSFDKSHRTETRHPDRDS